jgi:protein-S-isoprenylcysteine O-methyltransferase Ste14
MRKRVVRWISASGLVGVCVFTLAGTWRDPWLWAYALVWAGTIAYPLFTIDEDLARERFHPPVAGSDPVALVFVRITAVAHLAIGALDSGRWHLTDSVPAPLRAASLAGVAVMFAVFFTAMRQNRFFSAVVRIQDDRGHHVVDSGWYSIVRHPGYAGLMLAAPFSGLALGSWLGAGLGLVMSALIVRRVLFEDAFLRKNLEGYAAYAERVRHRIVPGVW